MAKKQKHGGALPVADAIVSASVKVKGVSFGEVVDSQVRYAAGHAKIGN